MRGRSGWSAGMAACAAAACAAVPLWAQDNPGAAPIDEASSQTLGLGGTENHRLSVAVSIDGRGPYHFVVDTGAERTVISKELASYLSLKAGNDVLLHSLNGSGIVPTAMIPSLLVSRKPVNDISAPALDAVDLGARGILGTDTLQKQRVLFDFGNKKMTISGSTGSRNALGSGAIVVTARSLYGRLIVADARVEGEKVIVVIDTGSDVTIGNQALRERLAKKQKLRPGVPITLISVLGNEVTADYTAMKRVTFGGIYVKNMPIAFSDVNLFKQLKLEDRPAILLGMDTLQLFDRVAIDFQTRKVEFLSPYLSGRSPPTRLASR